MPITIRNANTRDVPWMIGELESFAAFYDTQPSLMGELEYTIEKLNEFIEKHIVFIADDGDVPVGFILGMCSSHLFNPTISVLSELFWWVIESRRGSRAGLLLLNSFIAWGKDHADWISLCLAHNSPLKDEFFLKRGFKLQEKSFLMRVD